MVDIQVKGFNGINNVLPEDRLLTGGEGGVFTTFLKSAMNVNIDNANRITNRSGYSSIYTGTSPHSIFSDGSVCLFRDSTNLIKLLSDFSTTETLRTDLIGDNQMSYLSLNGKIYYADGLNNGVIDKDGDRKWGITPPQAPILTGSTGDLVDGNYHVAVTFVTDAGVESGSSPISSIEVTRGTNQNGAFLISMANSTNTLVTKKRIYISDYGSRTLYAMYEVPNTQSSVKHSVSGKGTLKLNKERLGPPPIGSLLEYYNGRLFLTQGRYIWFSEPFGYELFNLAYGYITLDSDITMLRAVEDGLFVSTESNIRFLSGDNPAEGLNSTDLAAYGAIPNTDVVVPGSFIGGGQASDFIIFTTSKGICVAGNGGSFSNITEKAYRKDITGVGAGLFRQSTGLDQYIVSINT